MSGRVVLASPPVSKPCEPDPALLVLAGYLRERGCEVSVFDANLGFFEELLSTESLRSCYAAPEGKERSRPEETSAKRAVGNVARALERLKRPEIYESFGVYRSALGEVAEGLRLASRTLGVHISLSDFIHPVLSPLSSEDLASAAREPELLGTAGALEKSAGEILALDPSIVGISASYLSQALHGFALAGLLRRKGFAGTLVLGGGLVNSWGMCLRPEMELFDIFDAVVTGPGEEALFAMAKAGGVADAPGVLAPRSSVWNPSLEGERREVSFNPSCEGLRWQSYLAPAPVLPVSASRGCYWAKCAFCPEASGDRQPYRAANAGELVGKILEARDRHGIRFVHFTDNALSPAHLAKIAEGLRGEGVKWYGFSRMEEQLTEPAFIEALAEGGCAMLQFGFESATKRLLDLMRKGIDPERGAKVAALAHRHGIRVYGYFLFGLPTESIEEARATVEWIKARGEEITFLNLSLMNFPRGGEMESSPEDFGIDTLSERAGRNDLSLYLDFGGENTLERRELRRLLSEAKRDPVIKKMLLRTPPWFSSNHAAFAPLP
jgi:hypothetical protein